MELNARAGGDNKEEHGCPYWCCGQDEQTLCDLLENLCGQPKSICLNTFGSFCCPSSVSKIEEERRVMHKKHVDNPHRWAKSLDHLFQSSYGTALFRTFLEREYAEENLDFVLKVVEYRNCSPRKRPRLAWKLYKTYVEVGAPQEVNLDMLARRITDLSMITPHMSTFDAAQKRIFNLMENDGYRRFLDWSVYISIRQMSASAVAASAFDTKRCTTAKKPTSAARLEAALAVDDAQPICQTHSYSYRLSQKSVQSRPDGARPKSQHERSRTKSSRPSANGQKTAKTSREPQGNRAKSRRARSAHA